MIEAAQALLSFTSKDGSPTDPFTEAQEFGNSRRYFQRLSVDLLRELRFFRDRLILSGRDYSAPGFPRVPVPPEFYDTDILCWLNIPDETFTISLKGRGRRVFHNVRVERSPSMTAAEVTSVEYLPPQEPDSPASPQEMPPEPDEAALPEPEKPRGTTEALTDWFRARVSGWPDVDPAATETKDVRDAQEYFAQGLTRQKVRDVRKVATPKEWRRQGRRKPWGSVRS